jgi:hypothetical protein
MKMVDLNRQVREKIVASRDMLEAHIAKQEKNGKH